MFTDSLIREKITKNSVEGTVITVNAIKSNKVDELFIEEEPLEEITDMQVSTPLKLQKNSSIISLLSDNINLPMVKETKSEVQLKAELEAELKSKL